jgi:hypothetical protein
MRACAIRTFVDAANRAEACCTAAALASLATTLAHRCASAAVISPAPQPGSQARS